MTGRWLVRPCYSAISAGITRPSFNLETRERNLFKVLSVIDEDIGVPELASKLVSQFGFSAKESVHYAELFIRKVAIEVEQ